jgi:DNA-binding transcriptional regulator PaaX
MNDRVITGLMIAAVMKAGQSYHSASLAKTFGISGAAMRHALATAVAAGQVDHRTHNGVHLYSLLADKAVVPSMKPLTISHEMRAAQERCRELRVHPSRFIA